jgi:cytochrome c biogenesis protein CcmG, thiol:disulfide interchange protein DsbE
LRNSTVLYLFVSIFICMLLLPGCEKRKPVSIGDQAPEIAAIDLADQEVKLKQFPGKAKVLLFWDSACCSDQLPVVEELYNRHSDKMIVVGVNILGDDSLVSPKDNLRRVVESMDITFPNGLDQMNITAGRYGVVVAPTYFFIDSSGAVMAKVVGLKPSEIIEKKVKDLLSM